MKKKLVTVFMGICIGTLGTLAVPAFAQEVEIGPSVDAESIFDADGAIVIGDTGMILAKDYSQMSEECWERLSEDAGYREDLNAIGMDAGGWVEYTLNVQEAGEYNMLFRMSSTSYSNVEVSVDGELQETIDFEYSTGHRLNWKNTGKYTVFLPEGVHTLRFQIDSSTTYLEYIYLNKIEADSIAQGVEITMADDKETARGMMIDFDAAVLGECVDQRIESWYVEGATDSFMLEDGRLKIGVLEESDEITLVARAKQAGEDGEPVEGRYTIEVTDVEETDNMRLAKEVAHEGMILLKNEKDVLPLKEDETVALFGIGQLDYVKGGGGSGEVTVAYTRNILEAMQAEEKKGNIKLYEPLAELYKEQYYDNQSVEEPQISDEMMAQAAQDSDTAVVVIRRYSSESTDRTAEKGDYYLSDAEEELLSRVRENFDKVVVVLNNSGMMDVTWQDQVDGLLMTYQAGSEGGTAIAEVLTGEAYPSGKLTDTLAKSYDAYPASNNFGEPDGDAVNYEEDIFVGYRYFETIPEALDQVEYCFGYGLGYTDFEIEVGEVEVVDDKIVVNATVTNVGESTGKEVAQVYFSAPRTELTKPAVELAAFAKTEELEPGESQTLELSFAIEDMSSYDDTGVTGAKSAYVLEAGEYQVLLGNTVDNAQENPVFTYEVEELTITQQLTMQLQPADIQNALTRRLTETGEYEEITYEGINTADAPQIEEIQEVQPEEKIMFEDLKENPELLDAFLSQLSNEQLIRMSYGAGNGQNVIPGGNTSVMGGLEEFGIPAVQTADGPAGIRLTGIYRTAFPCETLQASTWNEELIEQVGHAVGEEANESGVVVWLAPALNIHRDPLCGRNFEYYSEDPLISGKFAAAITRGTQAEGVGITLKHFAANNKEGNRKNSDSRVSERAMREIYLRGFEIAVKESDPWGVMSCYNLINGVPGSERYDLLTEILRNEWGFDGLTVSDWNNTHSLTNEIKAGNDVKMPDDGSCAEQALADLEAGVITRTELKRNVGHLIELILKTNLADAEEIATLSETEAVESEINAEGETERYEESYA